MQLKFHTWLEERMHLVMLAHSSCISAYCWRPQPCPASVFGSLSSHAQVLVIEQISGRPDKRDLLLRPVEHVRTSHMSKKGRVSRLNNSGRKTIAALRKTGKHRSSGRRGRRDWYRGVEKHGPCSGNIDPNATFFEKRRCFTVCSFPYSHEVRRKNQR